jgi:hypothetical protein
VGAVPGATRKSLPPLPVATRIWCRGQGCGLAGFDVDEVGGEAFAGRLAGQVDAVEAAAIAGGGDEGAFAEGEGVDDVVLEGGDAGGRAVGGDAVDLGAVWDDGVGTGGGGGAGGEEGDGDTDGSGDRERRQIGRAAGSDAGGIDAAVRGYYEGGDLALGCVVSRR